MVQGDNFHAPASTVAASLILKHDIICDFHIKYVKSTESLFYTLCSYSFHVSIK